MEAVHTFTITELTYDQMMERMVGGKPVAARMSWPECDVIRPAKESDVEYINYPIKDIMVKDCAKPACDCKIIIFKPSIKDYQAKDWMV